MLACKCFKPIGRPPHKNFHYKFLASVACLAACLRIESKQRWLKFLEVAGRLFPKIYTIVVRVGRSTQGRWEVVKNQLALTCFSISELITILMILSPENAILSPSNIDKKLRNFRVYFRKKRKFCSIR